VISPNLKTYFNKLSGDIKTMIKNYREKKWASILDKFGLQQALLAKN